MFPIRGSSRHIGLLVSQGSHESKRDFKCRLLLNKLFWDKQTSPKNTIQQKNTGSRMNQTPWCRKRPAPRTISSFIIPVSFAICCTIEWRVDAVIHRQLMNYVYCHSYACVLVISTHTHRSSWGICNCSSPPTIKRHLVPRLTSFYI